MPNTALVAGVASSTTMDTTRQTRGRWVRVAHSWDAAAGVAGASAARAALDGHDPKLLMVFASFGYDLPDLLAGVVEAAGDVPVIGCSTAGEIGPGPELTSG